MKNLSFSRRFGFAVAGIVGALRREASFRTQIVLGVIAAVILAAVRPPVVWVALCVVSAGAVLALELMNTALEHLADRLHPERHEAIRSAKDCAAGAVLIASAVALVVGMLAVGIGLGWL